MYCQSARCVRCSHSEGLNQALYHNLQEYASATRGPAWAASTRASASRAATSATRPSIQKPEVFFLPDLPTRPTSRGSAEARPWSCWSAAPDHPVEFETLYKAFSNCSLPQGWKMNSTPSGEWVTFHLVNQGVCVPRSRKCPRTYRLLGSLRTCIGNNVFENACLSVLSPGTVITEHCGPHQHPSGAI